MIYRVCLLYPFPIDHNYYLNSMCCCIIILLHFEIILNVADTTDNECIYISNQRIYSINDFAGWVWPHGDNNLPILVILFDSRKQCQCFCLCVCVRVRVRVRVHVCVLLCASLRLFVAVSVSVPMKVWLHESVNTYAYMFIDLHCSASTTRSSRKYATS